MEHAGITTWKSLRKSDISLAEWKLRVRARRTPEHGRTPVKRFHGWGRLLNKKPGSLMKLLRRTTLVWQTRLDSVRTIGRLAAPKRRETVSPFRLARRPQGL